MAEFEKDNQPSLSLGRHSYRTFTRRQVVYGLGAAAALTTVPWNLAFAFPRNSQSAHVLLQTQNNAFPSVSPLSWPWGIILCKFNDKPSETQPPLFYQNYYIQSGTGGVGDYWRAVSLGALDLSGSRVFGWFTMNHSSSELSGMQFPGARSTLVQWGIDTAQANNIDLSPFRSILVVQNYGVDHGWAGNGFLLVHQDPTLMEFGFNCHEMGHGFAFPHSWSANPDREYGDGWDIMSWNTATSVTSDYPVSFESTTGTAGPGLNARNLLALPTGVPRVWNQSPLVDFNGTITLGALNQGGQFGSFDVAQILPNATSPARSSGSTYTVEFRHKAGPDQGIPKDTVLIHEIRTNGLSYLQPGWGGSFGVGQQFTIPDPPVSVHILSIDSASATATVQIHQVGNFLQVLGITSAGTGTMWRTTRMPSAAWTTFEDVGKQTGGFAGAFVDVANASDSTLNGWQICGVTNDGGMWHTIRQGGGTWAPFGDVKGQAGNPGKFVAVGCATVGSNLQVCGVTSDGGMWHTIRHADGTWVPFINVKGQANNPGSFVDVAVTPDTSILGIQVCGVTSDGGMWHTIRQANGTWTPFGNVKGQSGNPGSFVSVKIAEVPTGGNAESPHHVIGVTSDGGMWHTIRQANGTWTPFGNVKGQSGNPGSFVDASCWGMNTGELQVCGITSPTVLISGGVWHTIRHADGTWDPFGNVKGQAGNPGNFVRVSVDGQLFT